MITSFEELNQLIAEHDLLQHGIQAKLPEVDLCRWFLRNWCSKAPVRNNTGNSLKHRVEAAVSAATGRRPYVPEGAAVAAALLEGYCVSSLQSRSAPFAAYVGWRHLKRARTTDPPPEGRTPSTEEWLKTIA